MRNEPKSESSPAPSDYCSATSSVDVPVDWNVGDEPDGRDGRDGRGGRGGGDGGDGGRVPWDHGEAVRRGIGEEPSYYTLKLGASRNVSRQQRFITLRVETCSSTTGRFLGVIFWVLLICFISYGTAVIVLSATDESVSGASVSDTYYKANLIVLSVALAFLVFMIVFFAYRLRSASTRKNRMWRERQRFLLWDARVVASITLVDLGCIVASYALYVNAECFPDETALVALAFVRKLAFMALVTWMTVTAMLMQVIVLENDWRNPEGHGSRIQRVIKGKQEPAQSRLLPVRLLLDQPASVILKKRGFVLGLFLLYAVASIVVVVLGPVDTQANQTKHIPPSLSCPSNQTEPYECQDTTTGDIVSFVFLALIFSGLWLCYMVSVRTAWAGQKDLPNARFRLSKLFLRIQMRYGRLLFFSILFTGMVVELSTIGTCAGKIVSLLGSPGAQLSLTAYACTLLFLYAPGTGRSDSITMLKSIAWQEEDISGLAAELKMIEEGSETDVFEYISQQTGLGKLSQFANAHKNVQSSVFCMEYCVKMFYFAWSAYKQSARLAFAGAGDTSYPFSVEKGMQVFSGLTSFKEFFDEETDTYCIMLRSSDTIVLSFRGTASRRNAMTDMKVLSVRYEPCRTIFGFPVLVHKGFWIAWSTVRRQIIDEVLALATCGGVERVFVTGHSLGGALACLCSVELQSEFNTHKTPQQCPAVIRRGSRFPDPPDHPGEPEEDIEAQGHSAEQDLRKIEVHTYTFGSPRVGNLAFGAHANTLLSNYWHVVTTEDPVARIPKGINYKRSGHRVLLGKNGNMEVYPSHFEASLFTNVGGKFKDHMMRTYGMRLGQFLKAQFVSDLTACESPREVDAVRKMAKKLDAESLGLEGLLCCHMGDLEDGHFEIELIPNVSASAPARMESKNERTPRKVTESKDESVDEERRWTLRLLRPLRLVRPPTKPKPGRSPDDDPEIGITAGGTHHAPEADSAGADQFEADETRSDIDLQEGLDDKILQILKRVWGE